MEAQESLLPKEGGGRLGVTSCDVEGAGLQPLAVSCFTRFTSYGTGQEVSCKSVVQALYGSVLTYVQVAALEVKLR
jgi:hypothetical protein